MLAVIALTACGQLIPERPDEDAPVDVTPDVGGDVPDIGVIECESDLECEPFAQCCLAVDCINNRCMPRYVADCCSVSGPCAVDLAQHTGVCEETCVAHGCARSLNLGDEGCDTVVWELASDLDGLASLAIFDDQRDRVTWHLSTLRPFNGLPSLRAGDVLCPTYHTGRVGPDCEISGEGGAVRISAETPPIAIGFGPPTLLELLVFADLQRPGLDALAVDRLDVLAVPDGLAASVIWSSSPSPQARPQARLPLRTWAPVLIDLSPYAGRNVRLRLTFDTLDGRDNAYEGVAIGRMRVRTACRQDREVGSRSACEVGTLVDVHPLRDALAVYAPPLMPLDAHERACVTCTNAATCPRLDTCDVTRCEGGRCLSERFLTEDCCTPDPRWAGDVGFEEALSDGWELSGNWAVRDLMAQAGTYALHFGLEDGDALAHAGEAARGLALSPPIRVPDDEPEWRFMLNLSTEWDLAPSTSNPGGIDLLEAVIVLVDDPRPDVAPMILWRSSAIGGTTLGAWTAVRVDLGSFAGREVRLGWRFDTVDADANGFAGVFIDDSVVYRRCPGCQQDGRVGGAQCEGEP